MSATNTGAKFVYNLAGRTSGIIRSIEISNTITMTVGDYVLVDTAGTLGLASAASLILGVCQGIVDKNGINMDVSKESIAGSGAGWTSSTKTVVTGSDNNATDKIRALVDIDPFSVYSLEPDATIGTTTSSGSSDQLGSYIDLLDEGESDENNNGNAFNVLAQLFIWGVDPEDSTRHLVSIAEHQIWGQ